MGWNDLGLGPPSRALFLRIEVGDRNRHSVRYGGCRGNENEGAGRMPSSGDGVGVGDGTDGGCWSADHLPCSSTSSLLPSRASPTSASISILLPVVLCLLSCYPPLSALGHTHRSFPVHCYARLDFIMRLGSALTVLATAIPSLVESSRLAPPVLPLIVRNPYLSTWLGNARDLPWEKWPMFWTGQEVGFGVLASVPEQRTVYPLLGRAHDSLRKEGDKYDERGE